MPAFHKFSKWNCCSYQLQTWTNQGLQSSIYFCEPIYSWNAEKEKKRLLLIKSFADDENHFQKRASFTRSRWMIFSVCKHIIPRVMSKAIWTLSSHCNDW